MGNADLGRFETIDGVPLTARPIEPSDKAALLETFGHLSEDTVYRRFLAPVKHLTKTELAYLTEIDHADHEALIALTDADQIVAVARYVRERADPTRAEAAVTVQDDWQSRGVGSTLLRTLAGRARANGITHFTGVVLTGNREMLTLFHELGPTTSRHPPASEAVEVEVELPAD